VKWPAKRRPKAFRKVCIGTAEGKCKRKIDPTKDYEVEPTKRLRQFRCRDCYEIQAARSMRGMTEGGKVLEE
jgi:hypothetical protein